MKFSVGYLRGESVVVREFNQNSDKNDLILEKIVSAADFDSLELNLLIYPKNNESTMQLEFLKKNEDKLTQVSEDLLSTCEDDFIKWGYEKAYSVYKDLTSKYILKNNLNTLENLFGIIKSFKEVLNGDRTLFFQEIWHLLKMNLGASFLRMVYPDVDSEVKSKLIEMVIQGNLNPTIESGGVPEKKLMDIYSKTLFSNFQIAEYNAEKGEMLILGKINKGPVLIMANVFDISRLQEITLKLIFDAFHE